MSQAFLPIFYRFLSNGEITKTCKCISTFKYTIRMKINQVKIIKNM